MDARKTLGGYYLRQKSKGLTNEKGLRTPLDV
jgi:hypothetical protein